MFDDLGTACFLKEALRKTYSIAESAFEAELALNYWCKLADASEIPLMKTMANTIKRNMEGIKGLGKHMVIEMRSTLSSKSLIYLVSRLIKLLEVSNTD